MYSTKWNCYAGFISPTVLRWLPNGWFHSQTYPVFSWSETRKLPELHKLQQVTMVVLNCSCQGLSAGTQPMAIGPSVNNSNLAVQQECCCADYQSTVCVFCVERFMLSDCNPIKFMAYWCSRGRSPDYYCCCFFPLSFPGTSGCCIGCRFYNNLCLGSSETQEMLGLAKRQSA